MCKHLAHPVPSKLYLSVPLAYWSLDKLLACSNVEINVDSQDSHGGSKLLLYLVSRALQLSSFFVINLIHESCTLLELSLSDPEFDCLIRGVRSVVMIAKADLSCCRRGSGPQSEGSWRSQLFLRATL
jgi:hypothetical protein